MAGSQDCAAIVDAYGLPIAYTEGFSQAAPEPAAIEAVCRAVEQGSVPVQQDLLASDGSSRSFTAFQLQSNPVRILIAGNAPDLTGQGGQQLEEIIAANDPITVAQATNVSDLPVLDVLAENNDAGIAQHASDTQTGAAQNAASEPKPFRSKLERWYLGRSIDQGEPSQDLAQAAISNERGLEPVSGEPRLVGFESPAPDPEPSGDTNTLPEDDLAMSADQANDPALDDAASSPNNPIATQGPTEAKPSNQFEFATSPEPVRFAWTVDVQQLFLSVSPELAQTVGPNAADIVNRKWPDVAKVFGFDRQGDIQRLLEKRDTWSGKTVLWPVQGTDLVVPVDLAALPAFSGARQFDGFRGFGIIRTADAVVDPDETGMALVPGPAVTKSGSAGHIDFGRDVERQQKPLERYFDPAFEADLPNAAREQLPDTGNVVAMGARKRERLDELSTREVTAFNEIGQKLVEEAPVPAAIIEPGSQGNIASEVAGDPIAAVRTTVASNAVEASILKNLPVPVLVYRAEETLYANPELLSVCGFASTEELAMAGGVDALFASAGIAEGANRALSLRRRDGGLVSVSPLLQSVSWDGEKALLLSFRSPAHEVMEEKAAIDIVRVSELQNILDTATDGILVTGRDGAIESLNGPAEALFGVDFKTMAGKHLTELFARESHNPVEEYMRELMEPGVAGLINNGREVIGLHSKGGLIPLFLTLGRMGKEEKFCAVLRDITQWKKAEEELVSARRAAETASEQKSEFLARVSHEIRTPLNAIIGFSDVMIEERFGPVENERYRDYLRDINRSGVHVLDLVNDLLDISKIEAGKMELTYEAVDLNQLVSETVALMQPQANAERIIIRTSLSRAVPCVVADARSVRQIILNLVSNAIKFTPANGQVIVSSVYEGNGEVVMRVRDTGRGMSQREIELAMMPFHQISVSEEKRGTGTGLGLPLTKALVEANRAYFDLESTPGEGTIAHVHFPTQRVLAD